MNLRPVPVLGIGIAMALAVAALGVTGPPGVPLGTVEEADGGRIVPSAGGRVCVTGADAVAPVADLLLLAADDSDGALARGVVLTLGPDPARTTIGPTGPGALERRDVELDDDGWLWVGWADLPLAAWQEHRTDGAPGRPRGVVASACLPTEPSSQSVLGMRTDSGFEALLRLANPFEADATFAVTFFTSSGVVEPVSLRNVSVPAGERVSIRLNDHVPEESDIAAVVTIGAGRLAVEGLQRSVAAVGGIEGVAALPPVSEPSAIWTFPWLPVGPDAEGSVWVLNPEERPVTLALTLHTGQGASVPVRESIEVGASAFVRIDTADLVTDGSRAIGLTLRSETTEVLAAAGGVFVATDPSRTGVVRLAGARSPDAEWAVAGATLAGRETALHVVNLDEFPVSPRIVLTTIHRDVETSAIGDEDAPTFTERTSTTVIEVRPLEPGAVVRIPLPVEDAAAFAAVIDGGRGLVVARTTLGREALEPVAIAAIPASGWRSTQDPILGRPGDGWVASIGTSAAAGRAIPGR